MKITFDPAASAELAAATRWYAAQAGRIQALDFKNEIQRTFALLRAHPALGTPAEHNTRHMVVHRYPYFVVYRVDADTLRILAIAHHSRRPGYWVGRR